VQAQNASKIDPQQILVITNTDRIYNILSERKVKVFYKNEEGNKVTIKSYINVLENDRLQVKNDTVALGDIIWIKGFVVRKPTAQLLSLALFGVAYTGLVVGTMAVFAGFPSIFVMGSSLAILKAARWMLGLRSIGKFHDVRIVEIKSG
jgi:hypothetical protein